MCIKEYKVVPYLHFDAIRVTTLYAKQHMDFALIIPVALITVRVHLFFKKRANEMNIVVFNPSEGTEIVNPVLSDNVRSHKIVHN